ncbi:MAG: DUF192 domain-containing protein [Candidatus Micrarchaeota archaeon]
MRKVRVRKNGRLLWTVFLAESFAEKTSGLMFKKSALPFLFDFGREATLSNSIHSFFCPSFDAVFLDSGKKVVSIFPRVRPFKPLVYSKVPARFLLELPPGEAGKVKKGDKLDW